MNIRKIKLQRTFFDNIRLALNKISIYFEIVFKIDPICFCQFGFLEKKTRKINSPETNIVDV